MGGVVKVIVDFVNKKVDVQSQKEATGKDVVGGGKEKKWGNSEDDLEKKMVEDKAGMFLVGSLQKFGQGTEIIFVNSNLGKATLFKVRTEIEPKNEVVKIQKKCSQRKTQE